MEMIRVWVSTQIRNHHNEMYLLTQCLIFLGVNFVHSPSM